MATTAASCNPEEWQARQQLAGCYRVFHLLGWTELIFNHISLRVPGTTGAPQFLINPFGLHYSEVQASNLVKVGLDGQTIGPSDWPINPAGFTPHATIHQGIAEAHCVMHTHTTAGMAVACSKAGLEISNFYAAQLGGRLATHPFEGITVHADEGPRLLASVRGGAAEGGQGAARPAVILQNHGLLAWGRTLPECFYTLWLMQRACEVQLAGAALGPTLPIDAPVQAACADAAERFYAQRGMGDDLMAALLRQVDRSDRSWRD
jgi:ribulose-5-phosphate 4-epimerase/fuculose-1-phosphate aldolase